MFIWVGNIWFTVWSFPCFWFVNKANSIGREAWLLFKSVASDSSGLNTLDSLFSSYEFSCPISVSSLLGFRSFFFTFFFFLLFDFTDTVLLSKSAPKGNPFY